MTAKLPKDVREALRLGFRYEHDRIRGAVRSDRYDVDYHAKKLEAATDALAHTMRQLDKLKSVLAACGLTVDDLDGAAAG